MLVGIVHVLLPRILNDAFIITFQGAITKKFGRKVWQSPYSLEIPTI